MLSKFEELALITRCATLDDRRAFGRLVEEYQESLRRFIFNLTMGDAALTDDLAQETFLKAYTSIRSFKGMARFKTWLYRIACNEFVNHTRKTKELLIDDDTPPPMPTEPHHDTERRHDVEIGLKALNDTERMLVLLFYMEDRPIKEIAKMTSMPEGTVKSYLSRAKTKMAKVLTDA